MRQYQQHPDERWWPFLPTLTHYHSFYHNRFFHHTDVQLLFHCLCQFHEHPTPVTIILTVFCFTFMASCHFIFKIRAQNIWKLANTIAQKLWGKNNTRLTGKLRWSFFKFATVKSNITVKLWPDETPAHPLPTSPASTNFLACFPFRCNYEQPLNWLFSKGNNF